jgi:acetyl-CoA carboxylase biotin carboxyl carrier protein
MKDITIDGIIDKFEESSLSELDVTYKELHVICKRYASYPSTEANSITHVQQPIVKEKAQSSTNKLNKEDPIQCTKTIDAPLVGTFFCSPSPDSPAFVKAGDSVKKGDTLCILEAMKMMNELTAEEDCIIEEILAPQGELVEFGQPIFRISS